MLDFLKKNKKVEKLTLTDHEETWQWRDHKITYSVQGKGQPMLMLHGINAASWGFEFRHNIEPFAQQYRVYVPDLPGFGRSERKAITYTADMYIDFIVDFARYVCQREQQAPAVIASSLTAAHTIGAVARSPENFAALLLVCPTGLERLNFAPGKTAQRIHKVLKSPLGTALFTLLTGRKSTRRFLGRDGYYDPAFIDDELIEGYYRSAHQPNAKYAPISFITFYLNHAVTEEWPNIKQPVLLVWGREAKITPLLNAELFVKTRPDTELLIIEESRLAPYDEQASKFNAYALDWFARHPFVMPIEPAISSVA